MYKCNKCGNKTRFIEHNCIETKVTINSDTGEVTGTRDAFVTCMEVICGMCNATTSSGDILDNHGEIITLL